MAIDDLTFNDTPAERRGKGGGQGDRGDGGCAPSTTPRQNAGGKLVARKPPGREALAFNDTPAERRGKGQHQDCRV